MADILSEICAAKREEVAARKARTSRSDLERQAAAVSPPRGFRAALDASRQAGRPALIAEIKRASPSKGLIRADFDPPEHARAYETAGATCLSVLTDERYFRGSDGDLIAARAAIDLPCLRKDFTVDPWQVFEARGFGADAILIIVAALEDDAMAEIEAAAIACAMDVLVEVHDAREMERALSLRSRLIGINNRDLRDFSVDLGRSFDLAGRAPAGTTIVAESGIGGPDDIAALQAHGIGCFLVGEALMREDDLEGATRRLLAA